MYGSEHAFHGWIEDDKYVYDPILLKSFKKDLYYRIYNHTGVLKYTKDDYCEDPINKELYLDIKNTKIDDYRLNGKKRFELYTMIPLLLAIAKRSDNQEFLDDLNKWLKQIEYDEFEQNKILF